MSECNGFKEPYFTYDCYYNLKKYYDNLRDTDSAETFLNEKYTVPQEIKNHLTSKNNFLKKLGNSLVSFGPYLNYITVRCPYINYWINEQIELWYDFDKEKYKHFNKFADEIAEHYHGKMQYIKYTCSGNFSYLKDEKKYRIMKALYEIYDLFTKIKEDNRLKQNKSHICDNFRFIDHSYNVLIRENPNDVELHEKLINFRKIVLKETGNHKIACGDNISDIMLESIIPKRSQPNSDVEGQKLLSKGRPESTAAKELEPEGPLSNHLPQQGSRREEEGPQLENQAAESLTTEASDSEEYSRGHAGGERNAMFSVIGEQQEVTSFPNGRHSGHSHMRKFQRERLPQVIQRNDPLVEMDGHMDGLTNSSQDSYPPLSSPEGILDKVQGAFSSIVENVDPAPVLGVSGGMGVLFILFKYTPVGSFFGGRRGRFRQIPRSFNGPFPGDFANFQEYGGGFVGYSPMDINPLAE